MAYKSSSLPAGVNSLDELYQESNYDNFENGVFSNAELFVTGSNLGGKLGLNTPFSIDRSFFTQIDSNKTWSKLHFGEGAAFSIKNDGTLWSWGINSLGLLGQNLSGLINVSSPTQVGSNANWKQVTTSQYAGCAVKMDGTLWTWGDGQSGEWGTNNRNNSSSGFRSSPTQVGSSNTWSSVSTQSFGSKFFGIKTDGTLWGWGYNANGELGLNDIIGRSSPAQIGSSTNWKQVSSSAAVKTDGTLWTWGENGAGLSGTLGLNDTINRSSPTQVGSGTDWKEVQRNYDSVFAIKQDGTLWAWGSNSGGKLGTTIPLDFSSPTQIASGGNNWKKVYAPEGTSQSVFGVKTDGTMWRWGSYYDGATTTYRSSPVQMSGPGFWKSVVVSSGTILGIMLDKNN